MKRVTALGIGVLLAAAMGARAFGASMVLNSAEDLAGAPMLQEERLATFGSASTRGPLHVLNPDGKTWDLLFSFCDYSNPRLGNTLVVVDTADGKAHVMDMGRGQSLHSAFMSGRLTLPDGKVLMLIRNAGKRQLDMYEFDPKTNAMRLVGCPSKEISPTGVIPMSLGDNGKVYGAGSAGHRQVGAYSYDPATGTFEYLGAVGPEHNRGGHVQCRSIRKIGDYLYLTSGKVPWYLIALNLKTRKHEVIMEAPAGNCQIFFRGHVLKRRPDPKNPRNEVPYDVVDGKVVPLKSPEDSRYKPAPRRKLPPKPKVWLNLIIPRPDGASTIAYRYPGVEEWTRVDFKVNAYPQKLWRLSAMRDGRLIGRAGSHLWSYIYDPETDKVKWLGTMAELEQFAPAVHHPNGLIYLAGYSAGPLFRYDPKRPWTPEVAEPGRKAIPLESPESNPRRLVTYHGLNMTKAIYGAALGADNNIYLGGIVLREGNGGTFGWWDVERGKPGVLPRETFYGFDVIELGTAFGGEKIILSTHTTFNHATGKEEDTAKLFVFDIRTKKLVADYKPIPKADRFSRMIEVAPGRLIGAAMRTGWGQHASGEPKNPDVLFMFDLNKGKVVSTQELPEPIWAFPKGYRDGQHFELGPDGHIWTYIGEERARPVLVRIDLRTNHIRIVGRVDGLGPLAFVGRDLYRGCEHKAGEKGLRRLRNIVPAQ